MEKVVRKYILFALFLNMLPFWSEENNYGALRLMAMQSIL